MSDENYSKAMVANICGDDAPTNYSEVSKESVRAMEMPIPENLKSLYRGLTEGKIMVGTWADSVMRELIERIAKAEHERDTLQATVTRLSAPVSVSEGNALDLAVSPDYHIPLPITMKALNKFVASRTDQESKPSGL